MRAKLIILSAFFFLFILHNLLYGQLDTLRFSIDKFYSEGDPFELLEVDEGFMNACNLSCVISWKTSASSVLRSQGENTYEPKHLFDGNYKTAWVEGKDGHFIGERIVIKFYRGLDEDIPFTSISVLNGYCKNLAIWKANSKIKRMKLYFNERAMFVLELNDTMKGQSIDWSRGRMLVSSGDTITLEILEVYPGKKYKDTAISEIVLDGPH